MLSKLVKIIDVTKSRSSVVFLFAQFFILGLLGLLSSLLIGNITESLTALDHKSAIRQLLMFVVISIIVVILSYLNKKYTAKIKMTLMKRLKAITIRKLFQSNATERQQFSQGDLIGRFNSDISSMVSAVIMSSNLIKSVLTLTLYVVAIAVFDLRLLLLFLVPLPFVIIIQIITALKSEGFITPWKESMSNTHNLSQDIINNQINIRSYSAQNIVSSWIKDALGNNFKTATRGISKIYVLQIPTIVLANSSLVLIGSIGLKWVMEGSLSIAHLITTIYIASLANIEFNNILNMVNNIPHLIVSANRIFPIWDLKEEVFGTITVGIEGAPIIEFKNVSFSYDANSDTKVLQDISFKVELGDRLGIIGKSGSGKSTIMKLILGQYQPTSGSIYFKGIKIQEWNQEALRLNIASVTQDPYLLSTTIRNNLRLIDDSLSDEILSEVLESLKLLDSFNGESVLDILCGEKGQYLSGGQRQRVSIARSLLKNADVILLDEATSALDNISEKAIQDILSNVSLLPTQILIAHRLSTLNHCNQILVLEDGHIIESGTPDVLINQKGHYYEALYNTQGAIS